MRSTVGGRFLESLLFAVSSLVLYLFGAGRVLFLVPLQVISVRRGTAGLASATGIAVVVLTAIRLAGLLPAPLEEGALLTSGAEVAMFVLLAGGWPWRTSGCPARGRSCACSPLPAACASRAHRSWRFSRRVPR